MCSNILKKRLELSKYYDLKLQTSGTRKIIINEKADYNYAYYPVIFESEEILLETVTALNKHDIFPRRYFYPPLNRLSYVRYEEMPVCEDISKRILCLPLYHDLSKDDIDLISHLVLRPKNI